MLRHCSTTGLTSKSEGGGATLARLTPPEELTTSGGIPRSLANEATLCEGELSLADELDESEGVSPDRRARFSRSNSMTRDSSHARCCLRWLRERCADSRLRMIYCRRSSMAAAWETAEGHSLWRLYARPWLLRIDPAPRRPHLYPHHHQSRHAWSMTVWLAWQMKGR